MLQLLGNTKQQPIPAACECFQGERCGKPLQEDNDIEDIDEKMEAPRGEASCLLVHNLVQMKRWRKRPQGTCRSLLE